MTPLVSAWSRRWGSTKCSSCAKASIAVSVSRPRSSLTFVQRLGNDLQDPDLPEEAQGLGRTLLRWKHPIAAWHEAHVTNAPTEATNNLIKRVKRVAFGFRSFRNYRARALLYCGKPNWSLLATVTPR
jgi:hypothetical protein